MYAGLILAVHAAAAACFLTTMTGFLGITLAFLTLMLGGFVAWERALLRGSGSPGAIEIQASGAGAVVLKNGGRIAVRAVRGVGVTRHWVALAPAAFMGRSVLVTAGMLGSADARLLRLWALWGRTPNVAPGQRLP
jgi:hypothetical protein